VALIICATACGSSRDQLNAKLYDAKATYRCLTARPDYLLTKRYADSNGKAPDPPPSGFSVLGTPLMRRYEPYYIFKVGPVATLTVSMYANDAQSATLLFFEKTDRASLLKRLLRIKFPSATTPPPAGNFTVIRNVFIDTTPTPFLRAQPVGSIILGCLKRH
jgi:hypothetical protein